MGMQWVFLMIFFGSIFSSQNRTTQLVLEVTVGPGDNITVYCDRKSSTIYHTVWYRYCTHENQPPLVLKTRRSQLEDNILKEFPNFHLVKNYSSDSYDLLITNMTSSYEGFYYCATEELTVDEKGKAILKTEYKSANVTTRIIFKPSEPQDREFADCTLCWMLLFTLCPVIAGFSSLFSSLWTYQPCRKTGEYCNDDEKRLDTQSQVQSIQVDDVWLASMNIQQILEKNEGWSSDITFCTYSPITVSGTGSNRQVNMKVS